MKELRHALQAQEVTVAPYTDSDDTLRLVPGDLMNEISFGTLNSGNYVRAVLELSGRAWASLQTFQRVVPAEDHILAGPAIFDSAGYKI